METVQGSSSNINVKIISKNADVMNINSGLDIAMYCLLANVLKKQAHLSFKQHNKASCTWGQR